MGITRDLNDAALEKFKCMGKQIINELQINEFLIVKTLFPDS